MATLSATPPPPVPATSYPPIQFTGVNHAPVPPSATAVPPTPDPPSDPAPAIPIESTPMADPPTSIADRTEHDAAMQTMPSILASPPADSFLDADGAAAGAAQAKAAEDPTATNGDLKPPPGYPGAAENGADNGASKATGNGDAYTDSEDGAADGTRGVDVPRGGGGFFSRLKRFLKKEVMRAICGGRMRPHGGYGGYGRPGRYGRPRPHGHHGGYGHHGRPRPHGRPGRHGRPRPHGHHGGYGPPAHGPTEYSMPGYGHPGYRGPAPPPGYPA